MRRLTLGVILLAAMGSLVAGRLQAQAPAFFPISDIKPGMVGTGRTVFAGDQIEEFQVHILGVLRNAVGPQRDLVLARLEGGPLAKTGVIQGMSGSPVYVNGRLLGAVSYSLGSFPKEALAGITPIGEMLSAAGDLGGARVPRSAERLSWPAEPSQIFAALARVAAQTAAPLGRIAADVRVLGPASLADLAPTLRPIGAAMVLGGFDPSVDRQLRTALSVAEGQSPGSGASGNGATEGPLRPGDPIGMALMRGDLEVGATGTVTYVDGAKVYGFGHPFLNMGPTSIAMTRARVFTIIPSLDTSMKVATLGPMIGTMTQDRATGVSGIMGAGPSELEVNVTLRSERAPERRLQFRVLHDQLLTPLFAYVAVLNAIAAFERQTGALTIETSGEVSFGANGTVTIDDIFAGDGAALAAAAAATSSIGMAAANEFRPALAERLTLTMRVSERQESTTIERVWLDTARPKAGETHTLQVLLRDYRGGTETVSLPVRLPEQSTGPLTLLVSDAAALTTLEDREIKPGKPAAWPALLAKMNSARRNNRLYVRLIASSPGTVVAGDTLPSLPASVRSVLDDDKTVTNAPVARTVIGSWEQRLNRAVRGSRELTLTVTAR